MGVIEVLVSPKGETTLQTKGYSGAECQAASKWLEEALGHVTADSRTSEFYEAARNPQIQEIHA